MALIVRETLPIMDLLQDHVEAVGSARAVARDLGVNHQTLHNWLDGSNTPKFTGELVETLSAMLELHPMVVLRLCGFPLGSVEVEFEDGTVEEVSAVDFFPHKLQPENVTAGIPSFGYVAA
jgi:transposase-like protein